MRSINVGFANGAEIDLKIDENFKETDLVTFLKNYADGNGIGGNILTSKLLSTIYTLLMVVLTYLYSCFFAKCTGEN